VSCEACHGPASKWLVPHTTVAWKNVPQDEKYSRFGMYDTKDMVPRAAVCIGCHVGQDSQEGAAKDVTHDLIAAGHPRLAFEFSAYMANMPAHWNTSGDRATRQDATAWVVGQALTAKAAGDMRAMHKARGSIEFADYDCYACHHELQGESWRRTLAEARGDDPSAPGELRLGTWYTLMLAQIQSLAEANPQAPPTVETAKTLETWINRQDAAGLRQIMLQIARHGTDVVHWDDATQTYLGLVALDNARRNGPASRAGGPSETDGKIRDSFKSLFGELTFLKGCRQEDGRVVFEPKCDPPAKEVSRINSPRNYDPQRFQIEMRKLVDLLREEN
jgi:hypothetical protein